MPPTRAEASNQVHAADDLHAAAPFDAVGQMDEAERVLWAARQPKRVVVDASGHTAYAMLDNGLDQADILLSVLAWARWGRVLVATNSTLAFV